MSLRQLKSLAAMKTRNREAFERMERALLSGNRVAAEVITSYISPDGGVTIEVAGDMRLRSINIDAEAYEAYEAEGLSALVADGLREARKKAKYQQAEIFKQQFDSGEDHDRHHEGT